MAHKQIYYSDKYFDEHYEYRLHEVQGPSEKATALIRDHLQFAIVSVVLDGFCSSSLIRHVMLPRELSKQVPKTHLMSEEEWRRLGVQQSLGWVHYMIHEPEPHILLFRRPLPKDQQK